jgi:hypothetical protein
VALTPELRRTIEREAPPSDAFIQKALDHDPFSATRQRPALADAVPSPTVAAPASSTPDVLRLIGTVVDSSGGSFVLCQLGADPTRVLRVGQALGAYQLHSVSQGIAIFVTGSGQRLELRVPKTGS